MRVGIVGYGKLGKAIEKTLKSQDKLKLIKIFSRRTLPNTEKVDNLVNYVDKIDLLFLCVGSQNELEDIAYKYIKNFHTIDAYDNHNRISTYVGNMEKLCKENNKIALCSFGWDPGLFSLMRGLYSSIGLNYVTTWGKGVSQGHTQAIKNIKGVIDAVQFTIPNEDVIKNNISNNESINSKSLHTRVCYVVAKNKKDEIKNTIVNMPDYFLGYETIVNFVSQKELNALKTDYHRGQVISKDNIMNFSLNLPSNPEFTARVLVAYANTSIELFNKKLYGAYTILDIPLSIMLNNKFDYI